MSDNDNGDYSNVVVLPVETTLDLPLDRILNGAAEAFLCDALVLGYARRGEDDPEYGPFYMASQTADAGKMLILLERAKALVLGRIGI